MKAKKPRSRIDERLLELAARCLDQRSVRALARLEFGPADKKRLSLLAEKANEGQLSADEAKEYDRFIELADILGTLRLKAGQHLSKPSAA
jgi:hypothetical protein